MDGGPETTRIHIKEDKSKINLTLQTTNHRKKEEKYKEEELEEPYEMNEELQNKFKEYVKKRRIQFLRKGLTQYFGKNFVVEYQPRYNFEEQWEEDAPAGGQEGTPGILDQNFIDLSTAIFLVLAYSAGLWISIIDLVFKNAGRINNPSESNLYEILYFTIIGVLLTELGIKFVNVLIQNCPSECFQPIKNYFQSNVQQLVCLLSFFLKVFIGQANSNPFWTLFQIVAIVFIFTKVNKLYKSLRLTSFSLYYEYQSKICDLIITLFFILNLNAIVLFLSSFAGYSSTWVESINIQDENQFVHYLYSLYYGSTTILTVGYGDISPKNPVQVAVIVFIQVLGIATLGYIINEIGYCISNLRKERQIMEKDLSIVLKMKKHYNMDQKLVKQARSKIVNNKQKVDQLYPNQQNALMQKFTEQFRNNLQQQNALSVVKSSIFFLTRWSINFQKLISQKIQHSLFNTNDYIYQPRYKERIYIVKSGKINIYADKNGRKKGEKNLLKTIDNPHLKQIGDNCYGYTAAIAARFSHLYAIAQEVTSAYYLDKQKFLDCISQRQSDFEYYHEIKARMDQSQHFEAFQTPLIESSKNHYNPTKGLIIRKHLNKKKTKSKRTDDFIRRKRKVRFTITELQNLLSSVQNRYVTSAREVPSFANLQGADSMVQQSLSQKGEADPFNQHSSSVEQTIEPVKTLALKKKKSQFIKQIIKETDIQQYFSHYFDACRDYTNYFPKKNIQNMVDKYELEFVLPNASVDQVMEYNNNIYRSHTRPKMTTIKK